MIDFIYTVLFIVIIYIPIFYRLQRTNKKLEERIIELEIKWENRNVIPLTRKK